MLLHLSVETFRGPVGRAPLLHLAVWLSWDGPDAPWNLTVLERGDDGRLATREGSVPPDVMDVLETRLKEAGDARVSEVVDTSDTAGQVRIRAEGPDFRREILIPMLSSGFQGPDAEALRDFLRRLLAAAGVASTDTRWATLGEC
ncbi:MAG TPA: hypothetical protein VF950_30560 [Planctomycetota bacterium]